MNSTLEFYENNAIELSARYESTQLDSFHQLLSQFIAPGARVLEVGCGSGRDASRALAGGYDIQAIDGSTRLLEEALRLHPELCGRLHTVLLPTKLPFADGEFDGFFSVACLMHFSRPQISEILTELQRVLKGAGSGLISIPVNRGDIDADGIDCNGRVFNLMPVEDWLKLFESCNFSSTHGPERPDSMGRDGISWTTFSLKKI